MVHEKLLRLLETHFGEADRKNNGECLFYSPFKEHRKKKLQINLDPNEDVFCYWNDWITDKSGKSVFTLLKKADKPKKAFREFNELLEGSAVATKSYTSDREEEQKAELVELPDEYEPLWKPKSSIFYKYALEYVVEERGLTLADIMKYRIGYCADGQYSDRIIVPSYSEAGELNYFVARDYTNESSLKYLNPKAPKNTIVFGSRIQWNYPVTLVEGVFDAIAARRNAIPLLGSKPSEILRRKLCFEQPPEVYIALDRDALNHAAEMAGDLMDEGLDVYVAVLENDRDPADMGFRIFQNTLRDAKPMDFKGLVSLKLSV